MLFNINIGGCGSAHVLDLHHLLFIMSNLLNIRLFPIAHKVTVISLTQNVREKTLDDGRGGGCATSKA